MRVFFKYGTIAFGIQALPLIFLTLVGNLISPAVFALLEILLGIYKPWIILIANVGKFKGESAIIEPVWMGISLGVVAYSVTFGFAMALLKRGH